MAMKSRKVISALSIGLSALMTLTPTMTAFAAEPEPEPTGGTESTESSTVMLVNPVVTAEAQSECGDVQEAVAEAVSAVSDMGDAFVGAPPVEGEGFEISNPEISELVTAVEDAQIVSDETDSVSDIESNLNTASEAVSEVKEDLEEAEVSNFEADVQAQEAVEDVISAIEVADNAESSVAQSNEQIASLSEAAFNTEDSVEAQAICDSIDKVVADTKADLESKQELFDKLSGQYETAKQKLLDAQAQFKQSVQSASSDTAKAAESVAKAQAEVDKISDALEDAQKAIATEVSAADKIDKTEATVDSNKNWDTQREVMKAVVEGYIITQLESEAISNVKWERVQGVDKQDLNYCKMTYTDSEGNSVTRYFNFDRIDKQYNADRFNGNALGGSTVIAIFEKSAEEVGANTYLAGKYGEIKNDTTRKNLANSGAFTVYAYTDASGVTHYYDQTDLAEAVSKGEISESDVHEVIQNQNNLLHAGNVWVASSNISANSKWLTGNTQIARNIKAAFGDTKGQELYNQALELEVFISGTSELAEKYAQYTEATEQAKEAVDAVAGEVESLEDAISVLEESCEDQNRIVKACETLGVEDVASFLGIEVSEEDAEALNNMTLEEAIGYLDELLDAARNKMSQAINDYEALKTQAQEIRDAIGDKFVTPEPASNPDTDGGTDAELGEAVTITDSVTPLAGEIPTSPVADDSVSASESIVPTLIDVDGEILEGTRSDVPNVLGASLNRSEGADEEIVNTLRSIVPNVTIEDEDVAKVQSPVEKVTIGDKKTPLSSFDTVDTTDDIDMSSISWWWLLIIFLLGATGKKLYEQYKEKHNKTA